MLYDRLINRGAYSEHQARNAFLQVRGKQAMQACSSVPAYILRTASLSIQLVKAIAHCHSRRVVHCDVKLENVLLLDDEEHSIVKVGRAAALLSCAACLTHRC